MLPNELLIVCKRKSKILPRYATLSKDYLEVTSKLIDVYSDHLGKRKKTLKTLSKKFENSGYDYRFVRGLMLLLDRKSTYMCKSKIDPISIRRRIFEESVRLGFATTPEKRGRIMSIVANETSLTCQEIEESLYDDLDEELILEKLAVPIYPAELLKKYNLSLTQTLLFNSTELTFTVGDNWQRIFYLIKKLGLIYEVQQNGDLWVKIDGPISLFKLTKRYGINIAKLLPAITENNKWKITAKILWKYTNEICTLTIESKTHGHLLKNREPKPIAYDSNVEEKFASQFQSLKSEWRLRREPEFLKTGKQVIIPDFSLERAGQKIYLEIVGFWTEEYLRRKLQKLKQVKERIILLVDEKLACEKLADLQKRPHLHILYYHHSFPLSSILRYLQKAFEEIKNREIKFLDELHVNFTEQTIRYDEFASRIGISEESAQTALTQEPPAGYVATHSMLISQEKMKQINSKIEDRLNLSKNLLLTEANQLLEAEGINDVSDVLVKLGYKVIWHGINSQLAEITRSLKEKEK